MVEEKTKTHTNDLIARYRIVKLYTHLKECSTGAEERRCPAGHMRRRQEERDSSLALKKNYHGPSAVAKNWVVRGPQGGQ